ncbi:DUF2637 domain-containing protein [Streptomyces anulatus]
MNRPSPVQALAAGAAVVTVLLTGAAFWLSYEHLHDVADTNGLDGERAWVWPATVDLFIIAGELLMLRAAIRNRVDGWAIALAATGSLGSIALNVAGVGDGAQPMEYVVAAVPPTAALVAFGALMRQVHEALATARPAAEETTTTVTPVVVRPAPVVVPAGAQMLPVVARPVPALPPAALVIRPVPEAVPAGARLLPVVAAEVTTPEESAGPAEPPTVTLERLTPVPEQVVTRPVTVEAFRPIAWPTATLPGTTVAVRKVTAAVPAEDARQVVTVPVTITPSELRKQARALNREVVRDTGRPVTIERLRDEYGLSRRDATELRRHVVDGARS